MIPKSCIPKYCTRCDQVIRPDEPYDTHVHHGATMAGHTTYSHRQCPMPRRHRGVRGFTT